METPIDKGPCMNVRHVEYFSQNLHTKTGSESGRIGGGVAEGNAEKTNHRQGCENSHFPTAVKLRSKISWNVLNTCEILRNWKENILHKQTLVDYFLCLPHLSLNCPSKHAVSNTAVQGGPSAVHHRIFTWTRPEAGKNSSTLANLLCHWTWSKAVPILGLPAATAENSFSLGLHEKSTTYSSALQNQLEWTCLEAGVTTPLSMHVNASNFSARSSSAFVKSGVKIFWNNLC